MQAAQYQAVVFSRKVGLNVYDLIRDQQSRRASTGFSKGDQWKGGRPSIRAASTRQADCKEIDTIQIIPRMNREVRGLMTI